MKNYRQQLSANAEDFDSIIDEMLVDYERLQVEAGKQSAIINDLRGTLASDTCFMCNWLDRGDCHEAKEKLQSDNDRLRGEMENAQRLIKKSFWEGAETQAYTDEPINITHAWYESRARKELLEIQDKNNES